MTRVYAGSAAALVCALLGGTVYWVLTAPRSDDIYAKCRTSAVAGGAEVIGGPFSLVDETGATVSDAEVITKPTLIYFGYTFCPDVCPVDNARNAGAVDILEEQGFEVTPVFITVDPARDTPEVMAEYTDAIHPRMIGLSGSEDQIKAAAQAYRAFYAAQPAVDGYYLVDHSIFTYLVLPEKGFVEFFRRDISADALAGQVACFLETA